MPNCPSNFENTQTPKFQPIYFAKKREKSGEFSFGWLFWIFNFDTMFTNGLKSMRHNRWKITTAIVYPSNKWVSEWVCMRLHSIQSLSKIHQCTRTYTHTAPKHIAHTHTRTRFSGHRRWRLVNLSDWIRWICGKYNWGNRWRSLPHAKWGLRMKWIGMCIRSSIWSVASVYMRSSIHFSLNTEVHKRQFLHSDCYPIRLNTENEGLGIHFNGHLTQWNPLDILSMAVIFLFQP